MSVLRLLALLLLATLSLSSCAPREARLSVVLKDEVRHFVDPSGLFPIHEIDSLRDKIFRKGQGTATGVPASRSLRARVWMTIDETAILSLAGPSWTEPIVLMLDDSRIREAELVLVTDTGTRSQTWRKVNERWSASEAGFRYPVFLIDPTDLPKSRLYLSVRANAPVLTTPRIADFQSFAILYDGGTRLLTLALGVRLAVFAYILALGISLKSRTNLWLASLVGIGLVIIAADNTLFDLASVPGGAVFARSVAPGAVFLVYLCQIGFAANFLRLKSRAPRLLCAYRSLSILFLVGAVAATIDASFELELMRGALPYLRLVGIAFTLLAAIATAAHGPKRSLVFVLAWGPAMAAIGLRVVQDLWPAIAPPALSANVALAATTLSLALFAIISSLDVQRREFRLKADVRHNAERFKAFAEIGTDASWEVDAGGRVSFIAGDASPLPRLRMGESLVDTVEGATSVEAAAPLRAAIAGRQPFDDLRLRLSEPSSREVWISLSGRPILDPTHALFGGSVYRGLLRDVSGEVERESRRLIEQQVFALGKLAGSVAHEINNLLHPVINLTKRLRNRRKDGEDAESARMLDLIDQSSRQAARVVSELLQTMRGDRLPDVARPLPTALEQAVEGIRPALPSTVSVELQCRPGAYPPVRVGDMLQVLGNLVSNAVHALDGHGAIRIDLSEATCGAKIVVTDNGQGMEENVRLRALQPFFSTKTDGRGTGVGLYIVQRIVGDYKGSVAIDSSPGGGTSVTIFIPHPGEPDHE